MSNCINGRFVHSTGTKRRESRDIYLVIGQKDNCHHTMFHFSGSRNRGRRQPPTISLGESGSHESLESLEDIEGKKARSQGTREQENKAKKEMREEMQKEIR